MVTGHILAKAARQFLEAVAEAAKGELCPDLKCVQHGMWMVQNGSGGRKSQEFEHEVINRRAVLMVCNFQICDGFPQQERLESMLTASGIPSRETEHQFLIPLVQCWLELPDPFAFEEATISRVLVEFANAVIEGVVVSRSRDVIERLSLKSGPVKLEEGVYIRPVTEDELWEFGDTTDLQLRFPHFLHAPSEDWNILDIEIGHPVQEVHPPKVIDVIREAVLVGLRLVSSGSIEVLNLRQQANYGLGAVGYLSSLRSQELGRQEGTYVLGARVARRLKESWPRLREIMESEDHYLRLPAQRLVDGGGRERLEDAVIDYAIGLEALLTAGIITELRYRFALRGATILAWQGGNRREFFKKLQEFYDVRSAIVHGGPIDQTKLEDARSTGENALRDVWWWHFKKNARTPKAATLSVDGRILK